MYFLIPHPNKELICQMLLKLRKVFCFKKKKMLMLNILTLQMQGDFFKKILNLLLRLFQTAVPMNFKSE